MTLTKEEHEDLKGLVGELVRVAITEDGYSRCHFGPQIAVASKLEEHKAAPGHYRVLVNDDCFSYFTEKEVVLVNLLASVPTIMLKIDVKTEEE